MRTVTIPASVDDRVAALRIQALHTTDRIVAAGGTPLMLWTAWSVWPENRTVAIVSALSGGIIALPLILPDRSFRIRQLSPIIGLATVSVLSWLLNGAFTTTGLLMWSTAIVAAIAVGRGAAVAVLLGSCLLLLSSVITRSEWVLPLAARTTDPMILSRFVLAFAVLAGTVLSVAWGVINPLERTLAAATDLVRALRKEQQARAVLDERLAQTDQDARLGIARHLRHHLRSSLASIERSLTNATALGADAENAAADKAVASVGHLIEYVRAASRQLRPVLLDDAGLAPALESLAHSEFGGNGIPYHVDVRLGRRLSTPIEVACYRIVQEAINNVVQHAHATYARLHVASDAREIRFAVEDNGLGFDPRRTSTQHSAGMGLFGMRRRSDALGGTLLIDSAEGRGTRIRFTLPMASST
jgi:signal transduction histidine kinase